jgi:hypothetical protein
MDQTPMKTLVKARRRSGSLDWETDLQDCTTRLLGEAGLSWWVAVKFRS